MSFCLMPNPGDFEKFCEKDFDYLNSKKTFIEKILTMVNMLQLTDEEIFERRRIVSKIKRFLKPFYPECDVLIFGSSLNGFGFKGCDLDVLFLPFPGYCNLDFKDKENYNEKEKNIIPSPFQIQEGQYPKEVLLCMEDKNHLKFAQRVLRKQRNVFRSIIFIPAKCPILSIQFLRTPITCDFSASNRLVLNNTELLWLFGILDSRVKPLVIFLRYWAKSLGFISKNLLSSYAFSLMVIFFLQNTQPPVLPSVRILSEVAGYSRVIDGWETAICLDPNRVFRSENSSSVGQLLIEFFEFYWNFDFIQNVVSPHYGTPMPVKKLEESDDERIRKFQVTPFSIQDAFVLSHNISRKADIKTSFKLALLIAKNLVLKENVSFQSLFEFSIYEQNISAICERITSSLPNSTCFSLYLNYELYCGLGITGPFDAWYSKVCETVLDVLQYGLLVECEVVDRVIWRKKRPAKKKMKIHTDSIGNLQLIMSIQCSLHSIILQSRKQVNESDLEDEKDNRELPASLRKQFKISMHLIKEQTVESPIFWFMCQCYKHSVAQIPDVIITISPLIDNPAFNSKKSQISSFVQNHVKKILEEDSLISA